MKRLARELALFACYLALAVAVTWPLVRELSTTVADPGDPLFIAWVLDWVCHALTHEPLHLFNAPIFHGGIYPLAYSEHMTGIALFVLPFHLAGANAIALYGIALLLGFAFSGYAANVLARVVTGNDAAAFLAGIVFAFASFPISHIQHVQIVWSGWLPLMLAALLVYWRTRATKHAAWLAAAFAMNGLTNIYWLLFGGFALAATIAYLAWLEPRRDRAFWLRLFGALAIAGLVLLPFLVPYQIVASTYGERRTTFESRLGAATWTDWLVASSRNATYGQIVDPKLQRDERELFPGLLAIVLAAYAFVSRERDAQPRMTRRRTPLALDVAIGVFAIATYLTLVEDRITLGHLTFTGSDVPATITVALLIYRQRDALRVSRFRVEERAAALWLAIGVIASLGWNAFLHPFLFRVLPPFRATRTPARWAAVAYVGLAVWAAIGATRLLQRRRRLAIPLILVALVEVVPHIRWQHVPREFPPVYHWLADARPGVVLELPMTRNGAAFRYVLASTLHRVPIINGTSGWESPLHEFLRKKEDALAFDDEFSRALANDGCTTVIVHEAELAPEERGAVAAFVQRLAFERRFGSDAVYAFRTPRGSADTASAPRAALPR
ncbi:MAG: hypothetical protein JO197_23585 [Acidobacteria bacterium]|nr:hypothetical protein [Acidobacteriota bacterium]MBV9477808.1 hypothetical protein [Acidobacteriota bacterium]